MEDTTIIPDSPKPVAKRPAPETPPTPPSKKKPRFTKSSNTSNPRRGGASYSKQPVRSSISIVPRKTIFPVFTSNNGCLELCTAVYNFMRGYDSQTGNLISIYQLTYVTTIAYAFRLCSVAHHVGYALPRDFSRLKDCATSIRLPEFLAHYIEGIGCVTTASGAPVAPFAGNYRDIFPDGSVVTLDPAEILTMADRPVPDGDWALDQQWILDYFNSVSRATRKGMKFRCVDYSAYQGRVEMLVTYSIVDGETALAYCPQSITEAEAHLGASYRYRDHMDREQWLGNNLELLHNTFVSAPFNVDVLIANAIEHALTSRDRD